ncbi:MAG: hypothetical protein F9K49_02090 [Caedimonadaceae bacterium]|nr:MAG: hypothetical protein F9K49_02090 [Caedimonadaceae bacterium]
MFLFNKYTSAVLTFSLISTSVWASHVEGEDNKNVVRIARYSGDELSSRDKKFISIHSFGRDGSVEEAHKMLKEYGTSVHYFIPANQPQDGESPEVFEFVDPSKVAFSIGPAVWCVNNGGTLFSTFLADTISIGIGTKGYNIEEPDDFKGASAAQIKAVAKLVKPYLQKGMQLVGHGEVTTNSLFRGPGTLVWKALSAEIVDIIKAEGLTLNSGGAIDFPYIIQDKVEKRAWKKEGDSTLQDDLESSLSELFRKIGYAVADKGVVGDKGLRKPFIDAVQQFNNRYRPDLPREQWRLIDESLADAVYFIAHKKYREG